MNNLEVHAVFPASLHLNQPPLNTPFKILFLCLLGNFAFTLSSADFFPNQCFQNIISGKPSESSSLDPDEARRCVGPDLA